MKKRLTDEEIFVNGKEPTSTRSRILSNEKRGLPTMGVFFNSTRCAICDLTSTYADAPLTFQLDHIDGDRNNNLVANIRFLCPNCHSQQPTWGNRAKRHTKRKLIRSTIIPDEDLFAVYEAGVLPKNGTILDRILFNNKVKPNGWNFIDTESCSTCGISEWNGKEIRIQLDHINGISGDNRLENLRFLCPNCHAQTPTFNTYIRNVDEDRIHELMIENDYSVAKVLNVLGKKGSASGYRKICNKFLPIKPNPTRDEIIDAYRKAGNVKRAVKLLGLTLTDANIEKFRDIMPRDEARKYFSRNRKVSDDEMLEAYRKYGTIGGALKSLGLSPTGGTRIRLKRLLKME